MHGQQNIKIIWLQIVGM